jgi:hypothetical protein
MRLTYTKAFAIALGLALFGILLYSVWTNDAGSVVEIGLL